MRIYPDLIMANAIMSNVRDVCRTSVCLVDELWVKEMVKQRHFLRILAKFDVVMLYYSQTVKPLSNQIERRCIFLPPGVDAILFCPHPNPPKRVIDVYSMGRRSQITHQRLLIPNPIDQNPWAHWRSPMDMMCQGVVSRIFRTFGWLSGTRPWLTR
jgi:hypothetical protein